MQNQLNSMVGEFLVLTKARTFDTDEREIRADVAYDVLTKVRHNSYWCIALNAIRRMRDTLGGIAASDGRSAIRSI